MNPTFIAIDTETTGLDPIYGYLLEVGWQVVFEGRLAGPAYTTFVKAPHGMTERQFEKRYLENQRGDRNATSDGVFERRRDPGAFFLPLKDIFTLLRADAGNLSIRPSLCFHNAPFDMAWLIAGLAIMLGDGNIPGNDCSAAFLFEEARGPFARRILDTQAIALYHHMRGRPGYESCSLAKLCAHFKIVNTAPHTAGGDARATAELALAMLREDT